MPSTRAHVGWVIVLLSLALVVSLSTKLAEVPGLGDKMAMIATALSLLLSILAIVYAFIANSSLSSSVGSVKAAGDNINRDAGSLQAAAQAMSREVQNLPKLVEQIQTKVDSGLAVSNQVMKSTAEQLTSVASQIGAITNTLSSTAGDMKAQSAAFPGLIENLGGRIDQRLDKTESLLRERQERSAGTPATQVSQQAPKVPDEIVQRLLDTGSIYGGFVFIVFAEVAARGLKQVAVKDIRAATGVTFSDDYVLGYSIASDAMGIIDIQSNDAIYTVKYLHPVIKNEARARFLGLVQKKDKKRQDEYLGWLTKLDAYLQTLAKAK